MDVDPDLGTKFAVSCVALKTPVPKLQLLGEKLKMRCVLYEFGSCVYPAGGRALGLERGGKKNATGLPPIISHSLAWAPSSVMVHVGYDGPKHVAFCIYIHVCIASF